MTPKLLLFIFVFIHQGYSANILFYTNMASYSHRVILYPLADALAKKGHQITMISPYHPKQPDINPNITEIVPSKVAHSMESFFSTDLDINLRVRKTMKRNVFAYYPTTIKVCEEFLDSPELSDYLYKTRSLDLLILDNCMTECAMGIVHKYKAKHVFLHTVTLKAAEHDLYGIIPESSAIPELEISPPRVPMSFLERVQNALITMHSRYMYFNYLKTIDGLIRKYMTPNDTMSMPFVEELTRNMSLVFYTGDVVTDFPRSFPPIMVNVAGIHCKEGKGPEELPKDVREFLDDDMDGFVYINFGSAVVSSNLPDKIKKVFFQTVEDYPKLKFLWKWNGQFPANISKNLFLSKWFPQVDIFPAHPKIKAFITQSGRPSTLESVCNGVPMIAFPVYGDQDANANRVNDMGGNVVLELGTVTREKLNDAIEKVVYDGSMKARTLELQTILQDRPMSPLDTAVWWTEYVLRHKDTSHLRPAGFHQTWFQRRMLDVYAFLFVCLVLIITVSLFLILIICKLFRKDVFQICWLCQVGGKNGELGLKKKTT